MMKNQEKAAIIQPVAFVEYLSPQVIYDLQGCTSAILCFDPRNFKTLIGNLSGREIKGLTCRTWLTEEKVLVCGRIGIGAPAAVDFLEQLIACGIQRVVSLGTAGALHQGFAPGSVGLCSEAFIDEGTSGHYIPGITNGKPSEYLYKKLADYLQERQIAFQPCKAWTTDSPFRETQEKLRHFLEQGADVVEMEASALFNLATYRKIDLTAVFVIGDSIADGIWKPYFNDERILKRLLVINHCLHEFLVFMAHG